MKIKSELEILNPDIRKTVISEIQGPENVERKREALKRYEIYKDYTKKYVIESLEQELEGSTVQEMKNRASNISIGKKIINKKARVYKNGATRELVKEKEKEKSLIAKALNVIRPAKAGFQKEQSKIDDIYEIMQADQSYKKTNRFLELQKNTALQIIPLQNEDGEFYLKMRVLLGHTYDVVENEQDPEEALIYVLSHFLQRDRHTNTDLLNGGDGRGLHSGSPGSSFRAGDTVDQTIADSEADQGADNLRFVWWSKSFHFTTNEGGEIINKSTNEPFLEQPTDEDDPRVKNEIQMQSIISFNKDQDGNYWASGGEDLTDGSVLINVLLTDLYFIAKVQGMGIFYAIGPDVPKRIKVGPNQGITIDTKDQEGPSPTVGFASSNPPLNDHMRMVEQYIALLLSTNDLAASSVQGQLTAENAASGIQELIIRSEVTSAIEDEQQIFLDAEPQVFQIIKAWQNHLVNGGLSMRKDFKEIGSFKDTDKINVKFGSFQEFLTEEQKLNIIKLRRDLGLDTMVDAIMRDNADLGREEAEEKLKELLAEKLEKSMMFFNKEDGDESSDKEEQQEEDDSEEEDDQDEADDDEEENKA